MSRHATLLEDVQTDGLHTSHHTHHERVEHGTCSDTGLPIAITKSASKQTYYTIRFLVDRGRVLDAFRAYAYFRWVDDQIDQGILQCADRIAFAERQQSLVDKGYCSEWPNALSPEECMLKDLIHGDQVTDSGLQSYIHHMMSVMTFDANRRGRLITAKELSCYTHHLAVAVTEALHYFIGHDYPAPQSESRYLPVAAAHITHMLRDTCEDVAAGYYNIPREYLEMHGIAPWDITSEPYREWVKSQVRQAREYFAVGQRYLAQVASLRCRVAGYTYMARFAGVLDAIERDGYQLRPAYPECKTWGAMLGQSWSILAGSLRLVAPNRAARA